MSQDFHEFADEMDVAGSSLGRPLSPAWVAGGFRGAWWGHGPALGEELWIQRVYQIPAARARTTNGFSKFKIAIAGTAGQARIGMAGAGITRVTVLRARAGKIKPTAETEERSRSAK